MKIDCDTVYFWTNEQDVVQVWSHVAVHMEIDRDPVISARVYVQNLGSPGFSIKGWRGLLWCTKAGRIVRSLPVSCFQCDKFRSDFRSDGIFALHPGDPPAPESPATHFLDEPDEPSEAIADLEARVSALEQWREGESTLRAEQSGRL